MPAFVHIEAQKEALGALRSTEFGIESAHNFSVHIATRTRERRPEWAICPDCLIRDSGRI